MPLRDHIGRNVYGEVPLVELIGIMAPTDGNAVPADLRVFEGGYADPRPDHCWCCDALPAEHPIIGLCGKCRDDLTT